jgi:hypothetical protein
VEWKIYAQMVRARKWGMKKKVKRMERKRMMKRKKEKKMVKQKMEIVEVIW